MQPRLQAGNTRNCIYEWRKLTADTITLIMFRTVDDPSKYSVHSVKKLSVQEESITWIRCNRAFFAGIDVSYFVIPKPVLQTDF